MTIRVNSLLNVDLNRINELLSNIRPKAQQTDSVISPLPRNRPGNQWRMWNATLPPQPRVLD